MSTREELLDRGLPLHGREAAIREDLESDTGAWIFHGIAAGVLGGLAVALLFFFVDLARGHLLWTPSALGAALFLGEKLAPGAAAQPVLVVGYTALHGAFFVAFGLFAASLLPRRSRRSTWLSGVGRFAALACGLFAAFELAFFVLEHLPLLGTNPLHGLGFSWVTMANALAALSMGLYLAATGPAPVPRDHTLE